MLGYISWRQFVYSCISCLLSADLFMLLLFSHFLFSFRLIVILYTLFICTCTFLFLIHSLGRFWRPWICMSRYWTLYYIIRCSLSSYALRGAGVSTYFSIIAFFFIPVDFVIFLILYILLSVVIPFLYSCDIMCGHSFLVL